MARLEEYDDLVIGSGEGGKFLAWHLAKSGRRVAVVERRLIGGSCPNTNCLPSKNEIWSAKVADLVRHAERFGMITGEPVLDMAKVRGRKREMVEGLIALHLELYRKSGAELIMGAARFTGDRTVDVSLNDGGERTLRAAHVFLNLGTHATIPPVPGLAAAQPLTHVEALELERVPRHLIVLGGGYVGLELAQAQRRFGAAVTIIEPGPQLASREDADVAAGIMQLMRDEGIAVQLDTAAIAVEGKSGVGVTVQTRAPGGERAISASDILVAAGRTPNTAGIGLEEAAGVALDARGYVAVNDRLETSAADVWAVGECAGSPQFTHVSYDDYRVIRDNLAGARRTTRRRLVPYCLFTDPPVARVGLSERDAWAAGIAVRVATLPVARVLRSRTLSETRGFMKALVGADDSIVGFAMMGAEAGEVVAAVQTAMLAGMKYTGLRDAIIAHPTMAEGLGALFEGVPAKS